MKRILLWSLFPPIMIYIVILTVFVMLPLLILKMDNILDDIHWMNAPLDWWEDAMWNLHNG